jgi:hypothetical protein
MLRSETFARREASPGTVERRKSARYRWSAPILVRSGSVPEMRGMSVEVSESGMSAVIGGSLNVGDRVELDPVAGAPATAVVRHLLGKFYGFEFVSISAVQAEKIRIACRMLPLYRSENLDLWRR